MLSLIDRKGAPVGYQAEIQTKAKEIDFDAVGVVVEEDESSYEDNDIESVRGEIRGTEIGDNAIEEAKNEPQAAAEKVTPEIQEEVTKPDPIVEDLTTP